MMHIYTTGLLVLCAPTALAQNDECFNAIAVGLGATMFDTSAATTSTQPWVCGFNVVNDLWYSYTATSNELIEISTCGSSFDTLLESFSGSNCATLSSAVCNDDTCGPQSTISVPGVPGWTFVFRVGGYNGASGVGLFEITTIPGTGADECVNAAALTDGVTAFSTIGASTSSPAWPCAGGGGSDIWYTFTAVGVQVDIDTFGSGYDTALELFEGSCGNLVSVGCNDNAGGLQSQLIIATTPGQEYRLRVGGFNANSGTGRLNVSGAGTSTPGVHYCTANANSTGAQSTMGATGTADVLRNDLIIGVSDLPLNTFGFFLASTTQGLFLNPGGSQGNLCLDGAIGRYVGPGQVMNSGTTGSFGLTIDNVQMPSPTGNTQIIAGETWYFQCWHRDSVGGNATSNFSDGLAVLFL